MAFLTDTGTTITDPDDKNVNMTDCYAVVDSCNGNKAEQCQVITLSYYRRVCTKKERKNGTITPFENYQQTVSGDEHEAFFGMAALSANDQYCCAYNFLAQLLVPTGQINEERQPITEFKMKGWHGDNS